MSRQKRFYLVLFDRSLRELLTAYNLMHPIYCWIQNAVETQLSTIIRIKCQSFRRLFVDYVETIVFGPKR